MKPVNFPQQTDILVDQDDKEMSLPVYRCDDDKQSVMSCWKLSKKDLEIIQRTGLVWVQVETYGETMQPMRLDVTPPFINPSLHN